MKSNGLWNFDPNFDFWSWGRFDFWVPKITKIESWEIQKSKLSHDLFGDEPFETLILWFLKLKNMFTGQALTTWCPIRINLIQKAQWRRKEGLQAGKRQADQGQRQAKGGRSPIMDDSPSQAWWEAFQECGRHIRRCNLFRFFLDVYSYH